MSLKTSLMYSGVLLLTPLSLAAEPETESSVIVGRVNTTTPPEKQPLSGTTAIQTLVQNHGDHLVTVQKIRPPTLPEPAAKADVTNPQAPSQRSLQMSSRPTKSFGVGATIYDHKHSLLTWRFEDQQYSAWVNFDFACMSSYSRFSAGETDYLLFFLPTNIDTAQAAAVWANRGRTFVQPTIPMFASDAPAIVVVNGSPENAAAMAPVNQLVQLYRENASSLKTAYAQRLADAQAQAAYDKAHPRPPKNGVIQFWRRENKAQAQPEGGDQ